jgi:prephenate dehydrogenase
MTEKYGEEVYVPIIATEGESNLDNLTVEIYTDEEKLDNINPNLYEDIKEYTGSDTEEMQRIEELLTQHFESMMNNDLILNVYCDTHNISNEEDLRNALDDRVKFFLR